MTLIGQTAVGVGILSAVGVVAMRAALSLFLPPLEGVHINALEYADGMVTQDRTVTGDGDVFFAFWAAYVANIETGEAVPGCEGNGAFAYPVGRDNPTMTLQRWVGSDECVLTAGSYELRGAWHWGDRQTVAKSAVFTVE